MYDKRFAVGFRDDGVAWMKYDINNAILQFLTLLLLLSLFILLQKERCEI